MIVSIKKLDRTTSLYSKIIIGLTIVLGFLAVIQIQLAFQQTNYAEVQSRSERILQARAIQNAVELCKQSPELKESGLYNPSSGNSAPCSEVLRDYND